MPPPINKRRKIPIDLHSLGEANLRQFGGRSVSSIPFPLDLLNPTINAIPTLPTPKQNETIDLTDLTEEVDELKAAASTAGKVNQLQAVGAAVETVAHTTGSSSVAAVSSEPSPQHQYLSNSINSTQKKNISPEIMANLINMAPPAGPAPAAVQITPARPPLVVEPTTSSSIFKTVVPGGKWEAKLQIRSYTAHNYCKNITIEEISQTSTVFGFVVQGDVILEIDDIELFTLSRKQLVTLISQKVDDPKSLVIQRFQPNSDIPLPLVIPSLMNALPKSIIQALFYLEWFDIKTERRCTLVHVGSGCYPIGVRCKLCRGSCVHPSSIQEMGMNGLNQMLFHLSTQHPEISLQPLEESVGKDAVKRYFSILTKEIGIADNEQRGIGFEHPSSRAKVANQSISSSEKVAIDATGSALSQTRTNTTNSEMQATVMDPASQTSSVASSTTKKSQANRSIDDLDDNVLGTRLPTLPATAPKSAIKPPEINNNNTELRRPLPETNTADLASIKKTFTSDTSTVSNSVPAQKISSRAHSSPIATKWTTPLQHLESRMTAEQKFAADELNKTIVANTSFALNSMQPVQTKKHTTQGLHPKRTKNARSKAKTLSMPPSPKTNIIGDVAINEVLYNEKMDIVDKQQNLMLAQTLANKHSRSSSKMNEVTGVTSPVYASTKKKRTASLLGPTSNKSIKSSSLSPVIQSQNFAQPVLQDKKAKQPMPQNDNPPQQVIQNLPALQPIQRTPASPLRLQHNQKLAQPALVAKTKKIKYDPVPDPLRASLFPNKVIVKPDKIHPIDEVKEAVEKALRSERLLFLHSRTQMTSSNYFSAENINKTGTPYTQPHSGTVKASSGDPQQLLKTISHTAQQPATLSSASYTTQEPATLNSASHTPQQSATLTTSSHDVQQSHTLKTSSQAPQQCVTLGTTPHAIQQPATLKTASYIPQQPKALKTASQANSSVSGNGSYSRKPPDGDAIPTASTMNQNIISINDKKPAQNVAEVRSNNKPSTMTASRIPAISVPNIAAPNSIPSLSTVHAPPAPIQHNYCQPKIISIQPRPTLPSETKRMHISQIRPTKKITFTPYSLAVTNDKPYTLATAVQKFDGSQASTNMRAESSLIPDATSVSNSKTEHVLKHSNAANNILNNEKNPHVSLKSAIDKTSTASTETGPSASTQATKIHHIANNKEIEDAKVVDFRHDISSTNKEKSYLQNIDNTKTSEIVAIATSKKKSKKAPSEKKLTADNSSKKYDVHKIDSIDSTSSDAKSKSVEPVKNDSLVTVPTEAKKPADTPPQTKDQESNESHARTQSITHAFQPNLDKEPKKKKKRKKLSTMGSKHKRASDGSLPGVKVKKSRSSKALKRSLGSNVSNENNGNSFVKATEAREHGLEYSEHQETPMQSTQEKLELLGDKGKKLVSDKNEKVETMQKIETKTSKSAIISRKEISKKFDKSRNAENSSYQYQENAHVIATQIKVPLSENLKVINLHKPVSTAPSANMNTSSSAMKNDTKNEALKIAEAISLNTNNSSKPRLINDSHSNNTNQELKLRDGQNVQGDTNSNKMLSTVKKRDISLQQKQQPANLSSNNNCKDIATSVKNNIWFKSTDKDKNVLLKKSHRNVSQSSNSESNITSLKENQLKNSTYLSKKKGKGMQEWKPSNKSFTFPKDKEETFREVISISKASVAKNTHTTSKEPLERELKSLQKNINVQTENVNTIASSVTPNIYAAMQKEKSTDPESAVKKKELSVAKETPNDKQKGSGMPHSFILHADADVFTTVRSDERQISKKGATGPVSIGSSVSSNQKLKHNSNGSKNMVSRQHEVDSNKGTSPLDGSRKMVEETDLNVKEILMKKMNHLNSTGKKKSSRRMRQAKDEDKTFVPSQALSSDIVVRPQTSSTGKIKRLINSQDKSSVSEYTYFLLNQVVPCFTVEVGIECQHCSSSENPFQLFPTSPRRLRTGCIQIMFEHLTTKCKQVPPDICLKLLALKNEETRDYAKIKPSMVNTFYERVWTRLHKVKFNSTDVMLDNVNNQTDERCTNEELLSSSDNTTNSIKSSKYNNGQSEDSSKIIPDFKSGKIVQADDQKVISEFQYFLLQQVHTCISGGKDVVSGTLSTNTDSPPSIGIDCVYCSLADPECNGVPDKKLQLYPTSARRLRNSLSFVYDHLLNCRHVTDQVKQKLVYLRGEETRNYTKIKPSQLDNFFETLWKRLDSRSQLENNTRTTASSDAIINSSITNNTALKRSVFTPRRDVEI